MVVFDTRYHRYLRSKIWTWGPFLPPYRTNIQQTHRPLFLLPPFTKQTQAKPPAPLVQRVERRIAAGRRRRAIHGGQGFADDGHALAVRVEGDLARALQAAIGPGEAALGGENLFVLFGVVVVLGRVRSRRGRRRSTGHVHPFPSPTPSPHAYIQPPQSIPIPLCPTDRPSRPLPSGRQSPSTGPPTRACAG